MVHTSSQSAEEVIRACAESNDPAAWNEFVARFRRPISLSLKRTACKWGKDPAQYVDDLLQETYLKLCADQCRLLYEFARQHSEDAVLGYIKTIAINVARDCFKSLHSRKRGGAETDQLHEDLDPAAQSSSFGGEDAMEREVLMRQVEARLLDCTAGSNQERDCMIFWLYYLQRMSAKAIAALAFIKLTPKGVEAVIFRLTRCVREHLSSSGMTNLTEP